MRFFAPEVVQTSAMDCGPAALKSILEGFGIPVSYGRLREACQTDVDGTSIDTIEDLANQLGLMAEQIMIPADHILLDEAQSLPAIVVVRLPNGLTHFLVVWSRMGEIIQVMDPATGRRWPAWKKFSNELYIHTFPVNTADWREWAGSDGMIAPLRKRMEKIEIPEETSERLVRSAVDDPGWQSIAALDASVRMVAALVISRGISAGRQAGLILERFYEANRKAGEIQGGDHPPDRERGSSASALSVPLSYWSVTPDAESGFSQNSILQPQQLVLRGAVMIRILGLRQKDAQDKQPGDAVEAGRKVLSPDLEAALKEPVQHPEREVWKALRQDGLLTPAILSLGLLLATITVMIQALMFQGLLRISSSLGLVSQRFWAYAVLMAFVLFPLLLELPISSTILRLGRRLEARLRIAFLEKISRLGDRYFRSRLTSDMTYRAYDLRQLRSLPNIGISLVRLFFQLVLTAAGIIWLDPASAVLAIIGTAVFVAFSLVTRPVLDESDLRFRTHTGALSRLYLDAMLGLVPAKTHAAERAIRREHEILLFEWIRAARQYFNLSSVLGAVSVLLYSAFSILIILNNIDRGVQPNQVILLFYWTLSLPTIGQSVAEAVQQYPILRNRLLRLLEPLGAPNEEDAWSEPSGPNDRMDGESVPTAISIQGVDLQAGGHLILENISLDVHPGEHIAIIGPSGAGKSSLVGLLLGWHRPAKGKVLVDGQVLDGRRLKDLRRSTAWLDPAVQVWNRTLYENLRYGNEQDGANPIGRAIQGAELFDVLDRLQNGLQTQLGEGGGLISGGEGQRVRLGRALLRRAVRLVIMDEPFRGLDREKRRALMQKARKHWQNATLLCITHDVSETLSFERVVVVENGKIIEEGKPESLAGLTNSRYRSLLQAEETVRTNMWASAEWRRLRIEDGRLEEQTGK
jgi:ATP-binding cassette subfamily B protein